MLKAVSSITNALGALNYVGTWNASTNNPALASGVGIKGDYYAVSTAGTTNLDGITNWNVGDWAVFNGIVWQRLEGGVDDPAPSLKSNATTGLMQIAGPASGQTRVVTIPDANATMARTDAAQSFTGVQTFDNQIVQQTNVIRAVKTIALSDNAATTLFTVTTTNESGSNDGGVYACRVFLLASFGSPPDGPTAAGVASKAQEFGFAVAVTATGSADRSSVSTIFTTDVADPGGNTDLTAPTVTLNAVSNYVTEVQVTSDGAGVQAGGRMTAIIELAYHNFLTAPVIS